MRVALFALAAAAIGVGIAAATGVFSSSSSSASAYVPPPRQDPIVGESLSPRSCDGFLRGTVLLTRCDPELLPKVWDNHEATLPGKLDVSISGRKIRVGGNPAVTRVLPADGNGQALVPGSKVTLSGSASSGSYLYVVARSITPRYVAFGEALFAHLGLERGGTATIVVGLENGKLTYDFTRPDGSRIAPLRTSLRAGPGPEGELPPLPAHEADTPEQAVRTYVEAIDAHDGKTICQLFVPSARATFTDSAAPCWLVVGGHIGYGEESSTPLFHHVELLHTGSAVHKNNYGTTFTGVPIDVRLEYTNTGPSVNGRVKLHDVVWFMRSEGGWRIGKASKALYAAFSGNVPDDVLQPPDPLAALHQRQADERRRRAEAAAYARSRVTPVPHVLTCAGHRTALPDPAGDVHVQADTASRAAKTKLARGVDLRDAAFRISGRTACATATFAIHPTNGRLSFAIWLRDAGGRPLTFDAIYVDFKPDGVHAGRVHGTSAALDPRGVQVGISGARVSVRFSLNGRWPNVDHLELRRVAWRVAVSASLTDKPLAATDSVPSDRAARPRLVRQSDGRLLASY